MQITLKAARINSDLTQPEVVEILAKKFDVTMTRQRLALYEKNASDIPIALAKQLSEIYDISYNALFFGSMSTLSYINRSGAKLA